MHRQIAFHNMFYTSMLHLRFLICVPFDLQVCCVAGFQARGDGEISRFADLEIGGTAGSETCATGMADSTENVEKPARIWG